MVGSGRVGKARWARWVRTRIPADGARPLRVKSKAIVRRVHARVAAGACVVEPGGALQFEGARRRVAYLVERRCRRVFPVVRVRNFHWLRKDPKGDSVVSPRNTPFGLRHQLTSLLQLCADFLRVRRLGLVHTPPNPSLPRHTPPRLPTRTPQQRGRRWQYGRRWSPRRRRSWPLSTHGARGWPWRRLPRAA